MTALFEIGEQHAKALSIIEQMFDDGCSDEELNEALQLLDKVEDNFNNKAINVAAYIRNLESEENAITQAKKAMDTREKAIKNKRLRLENYLLNQMLLTDTKQIKCPYFVLSIRTNPASLKVDANAVIPESLLLPPTPRQPDKLAIKALLDKGVVIEGCSLVNGQSLSIK